MADAPMNFRQGIDALRVSNAGATGSLNMRTQLDRQRTSDMQDRFAVQNANIVSGLKGIGDAIDAQEKKAMQEKAFKLDMKVKQIEADSAEEANVLKMRRLKSDADNSELDAAAKRAHVVATNAAAKVGKANKDAANMATIGAYGKKLPKAAGATPAEQAAWIESQQEYRTKQLKIASESEQLKVTKLAEQEHEISLNEHLDKITGEAKFSEIAADPNTMLPARRLDPSSAAGKEQMANFGKTKEKAALINTRGATLDRLAQLGGVKLGPDGSLSEKEAENWNQGGLKGIWANMTNDPNAKQLKTEMGQILIQAAREGTFGALTTSPEVKRVVESSGGDPSAAINLSDAAINELQGMFNAAGGAQAFFGTQAQFMRENRRIAREDFVNNGGYAGMPLMERSGVLHNLIPNSFKEAGTTTYVDPEKSSPQALSDIAFGTGNYVVPKSWNEDYQAARAFKDGSAIAYKQREDTHVWKNPENKARIAETNERRRKANNTANSAPAGAGIDPNKKLTTVPAGEQYSPSGKDNVTAVYDENTGQYKVVSAPNGKAYAGATPPSSGKPSAQSVSVGKAWGAGEPDDFTAADTQYPGIGGTAMGAE